MDDLISRKAAKDMIREMSPALFSAYQHETYVDKQEVMIRLMALPSAQPEQKKGKWIKVEKVFHTRFHSDQPDTYHEYRCTVCLKASDKATNFCPNCGAEMEAVDA